MATFNYFVSAKKREMAPIYVRLSAGEKVDLIVKTGLFVNPVRWSNDTQTIKQRIKTDEDEKLIKKLKGLKDHIDSEFKNFFGDYSKEWLIAVIYRFHNKKNIDAKTLNDYIDKFISDAEKGEKKNKSAMNFAPGTVRIFKGFKRIFDEYQGIYTEKRIKWHRDNNKPLRPFRKLDFENITTDFYNSFVSFLSDEGYALNTMGRFIKSLKMIMKKSLQEKKHNNREFEYEAFRGISEETFAIYLTETELNEIYKYNLKQYPRFELARDAFMVLCETALRISDYNKVDVSIRIIEGKKFIDIIQSKTGGRVIIPLTARMDAILKKYGNNLPRIPEQYVNEYIKIVAKWCGINEQLQWNGSKFGKKYQRTALKHELITCHTGRRTACTNMFLAGIPLKDIREISGHKSDKQLLDYIKVTKEQTALRLSEHEYFSGNVLKIV
jgi:site-specific recombinase XerD